jgi:VanZ family protein
MNFAAINRFSRFFYILSLLVVYLINVPILYFYILFFFISVEVLLLKKSKSETKSFKFSQLFFIVFVCYVLLVRSFIFGSSDVINSNLNTIEHLLFAIVICLLIFYYILFYFKNKIGNSILFSVLIFNIIGLFNEFFQNYFLGRPVFILEEFSFKDLIANALGTIIFIVIIKFLTIRMSFLNSIEK